MPLREGVPDDVLVGHFNLDGERPTSDFTAVTAQQPSRTLLGRLNHTLTQAVPPLFSGLFFQIVLRESG